MEEKDSIESMKKQLNELGDSLNKEAIYAKRFLGNSKKRPKNEHAWFRSVRDVCIYGTFLIKILIDELNNFSSLSKEQLGFYIGKIAIQSFLDLINALEFSLIKLIENNEDLDELLNSRVKKKTEMINANWKGKSGKAKKLKKDLLKLYNRKKYEMKFVRDTLFNAKVIGSLDLKILDFCWDIRNSMHSNYVAIKDIEFSAPGTSLNYKFDFKKGQELYHPGDLKSFYMMTEQIIFIQHKILTHFNNKTTENSD